MDASRRQLTAHIKTFERDHGGSELLDLILEVCPALGDLFEQAQWLTLSQAVIHDLAGHLDAAGLSCVIIETHISRMTAGGRSDADIQILASEVKEFGRVLEAAMRQFERMSSRARAPQRAVSADVGEVWAELVRHGNRSTIKIGISGLRGARVSDRRSALFVLAQLYSNSVDALGRTSRRPGNRPEINLAVSRAPESHLLMLRIEDSGDGFDWSNLSSIFDAGFTSYPERPGLGLYLARRVALRAGGDLYAERVGQRLSFVFLTRPE